MTADERRLMQQRAVGVAACAAAAAYGAPQIADHVAEQKVQQAFLEEAGVLALALSTAHQSGAPIHAIDEATPWSQQVSYADSASDNASLVPAITQSFVDFLVNIEPRNPSMAKRQKMDQVCMAEAIYYEARSENLNGQLAVAEVVLNRVSSGFYPDNVCGVVYQGAMRSTGCQFSFTCDGSLNRKPVGESWDEAKRVAAYVLTGMHTRSITNHATHYHTNYVDPYWRVGLVHTATIGTHIFYRFRHDRDWQTVQAAFASVDKRKDMLEQRAEVQALEAAHRMTVTQHAGRREPATDRDV